jgi:DnaJ-class molecular chaperone
MDLYEILNVSHDCNVNDIKKSYHKLAKLYHPDKINGSTEKFQQLNYAYNILSNENTRIQYNIMNNSNKNKLIVFLEKWFNTTNFSHDIKKMFNLSDNIFDNINNYDFSDIIMYFTNNLIPKKPQTDTIDCSDSDVESWDETQAEYYETLPLKYHHYNKNDINIELKCTLDEIISGSVRHIKIKRRINNMIVCTSFSFFCNHPYIIFNQGGDYYTMNGNLIIKLTLPKNYTWENNNIIYNHNINLYEFIYGVDLNIDFCSKYIDKLFDIKKWIPYRDGIDINIINIAEYIFKIKLNINYNNMDTTHHNIMNTYFKQTLQ